MKGIKTFNEIIKESSDSDSYKDMMMDLEDLGVKVLTFCEQDIVDTFHELISKESFTDGGYSEVSIIEDYVTELSTGHPANPSIEVMFTGSVEAGEVDVKEIVTDLLDALEKNEDTKMSTPRWTEEEIGDSINDCNWQSYISVNDYDLEAEVLSVHYQNNEIEIEYGLKDASYFVEVDLDGMIGEIVADLHSIRN